MACHVLWRGHANEELFQGRDQTGVDIRTIVWFQLDVVPRGGQHYEVTASQAHQSRPAGLRGCGPPEMFPWIWSQWGRNGAG